MPNAATLPHPLANLTTPRAKHVFQPVEDLGACRTHAQREKAIAFGATRTVRVPGKFHWVAREAARRGFEARVVGYTNAAYCVATVYAFRPAPGEVDEARLTHLHAMTRAELFAVRDDRGAL